MIIYKYISFEIARLLQCIVMCFCWSVFALILFLDNHFFPELLYSGLCEFLCRGPPTMVVTIFTLPQKCVALEPTNINDTALSSSELRNQPSIPSMTWQSTEQSVSNKAYTNISWYQQQMLWLQKIQQLLHQKSL